MPTSLDQEKFDSLFTTFSKVALRIETRRWYDEPAEEAPLRRFTAHEPPDDTWMADYLTLLQQAQAKGRSIRRVRVLDEPPTDYQRFVMDLAMRRNMPAGEDLRTLSRGAADELGATRDFWIFDDVTVALMRFDDNGRFEGAELVSDDVEGFRDLSRRAWEAARRCSPQQP